MILGAMSMANQNRPRYMPNTSKALEVILWLGTRQRGIDVYHLVKAAFFADKSHITEYGRPIIGDDYEAKTYGPLPRVIYGLLKHDLLEIQAAGTNGKLPFEIKDAYCVYPDRPPNLRRLSQSDVEALEYGYDIVKDKSFDELVELTHDDPAYINADGGMMDYRDFIPSDDPERDEKAQDILEVARYAVV